MQIWLLQFPQYNVWFKNFCMVTRSGYHGTESGSPSGRPCSQHWDFRTNFKESLKFLVQVFSKSGYQQPKSGSPSKFQVAWGYWATTKSYTDNINFISSADTPRNAQTISDDFLIKNVRLMPSTCRPGAKHDNFGDGQFG